MYAFHLTVLFSSVMHRNKLTHTDLKPENILFVDSAYDLEYNAEMVSTKYNTNYYLLYSALHVCWFKKVRSWRNILTLLLRRETRERWRTQMWKWSILGMLHMRTSITPPWCPRDITVHLKSFWVILSCSLCERVDLWSPAVTLWHWRYFILLHRAGLGLFLWYMERRLHSYWILPWNNTLPGECKANENMQPVRNLRWITRS